MANIGRLQLLGGTDEQRLGLVLKEYEAFFVGNKMYIGDGVTVGGNAVANFTVDSEGKTYENLTNITLEPYEQKELSHSNPGSIPEMVRIYKSEITLIINEKFDADFTISNLVKENGVYVLNFTETEWSTTENYDTAGTTSFYAYELEDHSNIPYPINYNKVDSTKTQTKLYELNPDVKNNLGSTGLAYRKNNGKKVTCKYENYFTYIAPSFCLYDKNNSLLYQSSPFLNAPSDPVLGDDEWLIFFSGYETSGTSYSQQLGFVVADITGDGNFAMYGYNMKNHTRVVLDNINKNLTTEIDISKYSDMLLVEIHNIDNDNFFLFMQTQQASNRTYILKYNITTNTLEFINFINSNGKTDGAYLPIGVKCEVMHNGTDYIISACDKVFLLKNDLIYEIADVENYTTFKYMYWDGNDIVLLHSSYDKDTYIYEIDGTTFNLIHTQLNPVSAYIEVDINVYYKENVSGNLQIDVLYYTGATGTTSDKTIRFEFDDTLTLQNTPTAKAIWTADTGSGFEGDCLCADRKPDRTFVSSGYAQRSTFIDATNWTEILKISANSNDNSKTLQIRFYGNSGISNLTDFTGDINLDELNDEMKGAYATGSYQVTGTTGTDEYDLTINSISLMNTPVSYATSAAATALAIVDEINSTQISTDGDYIAAIDPDNTDTIIFTNVNKGSEPNGDVVANDSTGPGVAVDITDGKNTLLQSILAQTGDNTFKYKISFSTDDTSITPSFNSLQFQIVSNDRNRNINNDEIEVSFDSNKVYFKNNTNKTQTINATVIV